MRNLLRQAIFRTSVFSTPTGLAFAFLSFLGQQVFAYSPPLQAVDAWIETNSIATTIRYRVFDPKLNAYRQGSTQYGRSAGSFWRVPDGFFSNSGGIVAWRIEYIENGDDLSDEEVGFAVYDPGVGAWRQSSVRYAGFPTPGVVFWIIPSASFFLNRDGVLAWRMEEWEPDPLGGSDARDEEVGFATYDPERGSWQISRDRRAGWPYDFWDVPSASFFWNRDGVVAGRWEEWQPDPLGGSDLRDEEIKYAIYDPVRGAWCTDSVRYPGSPNDFWDIASLAVNQSSVSWTANRWRSGSIVGSENRTRGYSPPNCIWNDGITRPLAYLATSPTSGSPPLVVWFTDMSLGATGWFLDFGDGTPGTSERSASHVYPTGGVFTVVQTVTGPGASHPTTNTINAVPPHPADISPTNSAVSAC